MESGIRNPESGIRKRNHGYGNGIRERFQAIDLKKKLAMTKKEINRYNKDTNELITWAEETAV